MFLQNLIETRGIESAIGDASAYGRWLVTNTGGDTTAGVNVSEQSALTLPYVYACINVLSQTLAHVPLQLLKEGKAGPAPATRHPLFELTRTPHHEYSSYTWRETLEGHRNGWGNGYAQIKRDASGYVELPILYPDRTTPRRDQKTKSLVYTSTNPNGGSDVHLAADVLHFAGLGFDGMRGYSPIHQAREAIGLGLAIHKFGGSFFGNDASPKAVIESEVPANSLTKFAEEFRAQHGSLEKANGTPILPKGLTYKPVTMNPDDAQTLETLKYNRTEICGIYRVPPQFVMDLERSTFTNASEMDVHFVKHTMIPIFSNWEAELNRKLLTVGERRRGFYFKFNVNGLLRGSQKERFDAYHVALQDGWISRNEVRVLEDKPIEEGLDEFLTPNNMVTANAASGDDSIDEPTRDFIHLVTSIAERMASRERRALERAGEKIEEVAELYKDYPDFIKRTALPTAMTIFGDSGIAENFMSDFAKRYIDQQLRQKIERVGDLKVRENDIINTFYEVLNEQ